MAETTPTVADETKILSTIKDLLGIPQEIDTFDNSLLITINSSFGTLNQLGVGPSSGFVVKDSKTLWSDFSVDQMINQLAKPFVYLNTRLQFDPPANSFLVTSINDQIKELTFRLLAQGNGAFNE